MKHVYVAGKFSGDNAWKIEQNIRRAEEAGLLVAQFGGVPVIPHTMYRFFHGTLPYERWIEITADLLRRSDAILMLPFWKDSDGSVGEYELATALVLPIFHYGEDNNLRLQKYLAP